MLNTVYVCIIIIITLAILICIIEAKQFNKLKENILSHLDADYSKITGDLLNTYRSLYRSSPDKFIEAHIKLKTLKEIHKKDTMFDEQSKMIISLVPLIAMAVTLAVTAFKDSNGSFFLVYNGFLAIISGFSIMIIALFFFSQVSAFSHSKSNKLIVEHLMMMEEVIRNPSKIYLP
ncbi:MAG TPA: hypothetical protein DEF35_08925 [Paenibacillus sp.]|uniref:hypothetical protein n=1 Tax=Paenibacillus TaxID=44249 RepID=UPI000B9FCADF|nr:MULTISPECIES: hypothetical protein [Paenibacillus]OZQ64356.1 hypothetical protein CA599_22595 [Paenibacillus taichungensis]HBU81748.1 hypothetical protein [Paenibacillus sp.]